MEERIKSCLENIKGVWYIMKKMKVELILACVMAMSVLMGGCGGAEATEASAVEESNEVEAVVEAIPAKPVQEIYEEIAQAVELQSPVPMTDSFISNYYGINPEKLEEYVFVMSEEATSAETVAIMKVKEEGDVENIKAALQVLVDEKRGEMEDYLPEQFEIVDKSSVKTKGNYVYLVISGQADAITKIIENGI